MVRRILLSLPVLALGGLLAGAVPALAASALVQMASPNVPGSNFNELDGVASVSSSQAWSVGFSRVGSNPFRALILHFTGSAWSIVASAPRPAADDTRLHGLAVLSATNVWAVGSDTGSTGHSLIEHWNGSSWSAVPSPSNEPAGAELKGVSAISATNVWAVGDVSNFGFEPLIEHFDGRTWTVVPGASILTTNHDFLLSVAGSGANDVWAVGRTFRHPVPLIEHFDGNSWTQVSQPVSGYDSALNSVAVLSSTDAWAVGEQSLNETVTEHWDGHRWTLISSPSVTDNNAQDVLAGVAALSPTDVWVVGQSSINGLPQTLAVHWDGSAWTIVSSPNTNDALLSGTAGSGVGLPLWAVGNSGGNPQLSLIVRGTG